MTVSPIAGFGEASITDVQVVLGKATPVNISMQAAGATEIVQVTASDVQIDPTDSKIQTNITARVAELLPKGTNFTSLLQIAPAVGNELLVGVSRLTVRAAQRTLS